MTTESFTVKVLVPSDGMHLTNGSVISDGKVYLGVNDSPDNWHEITDEEAEKLRAEEKERYERERKERMNDSSGASSQPEVSSPEPAEDEPADASDTSDTSDADASADEASESVSEPVKEDSTAGSSEA